jgi:hypothetical protein
MRAHRQLFHLDFEESGLVREIGFYVVDRRQVVAACMLWWPHVCMPLLCTRLCLVHVLPTVSPCVPLSHTYLTYCA